MKWGLPILSAIAAVTVVELVLSKIWGYNLSNSPGIFCGETRKAKNTKGGLQGGQTTWKLRRIFSSGGGHLILFKGLLLQGSPYCI